MNPEWQGLLANILANPNDDFPREVAADWLEDHGGEQRAEYIRLQLRYAQLECEYDVHKIGPIAASHPAAVEIERLHFREKELRGAYGLQWLSADCPLVQSSGPLVQSLGWEPYEEAYGCLVHPIFLSNNWQYALVVYYRRGFIDEVACAWAWFVQHQNQFRTCCPLTDVRWLTLPTVLLADHRMGQKMFGYVHGLDKNVEITNVDIQRETWEQMRRRKTKELLELNFPGVCFDLTIATDARESRVLDGNANAGVRSFEALFPLRPWWERRDLLTFVGEPAMFQENEVQRMRKGISHAPTSVSG